MILRKPRNISREEKSMINVIYRPDEGYIRYARELQCAANGISIRFLTRYFHVQIPLRMQIRGHYFAIQEADYKYPMKKKKQREARQWPLRVSLLTMARSTPRYFPHGSSYSHPMHTCLFRLHSATKYSDRVASSIYPFFVFLFL